MKNKQYLVSCAFVGLILVGVVCIIVLTTPQEENKNSAIRKDGRVDTFSSQASLTSYVQDPAIVDEKGMGKAVSKLEQALTAQDASSMEALLTEQVVLSINTEGQTGDIADKQKALEFLNTHWTNDITVVSRQYVEHFGFWEIETTGWKEIPSKRVYLRYFRYDDQDLRNISYGDWLIYAIIF